MLKNSLYQIAHITHNDVSVQAELTLNSEHKIFNGHFPGQPVLPGACMLQILKEVLEVGLGEKLRLKKADQMKFLTMVDPDKDKELKLDATYSKLENNHLMISASLAQNAVCFKFKGTFILIYM